MIPELRIGAAVFRNVEGHEDAEAPDWPKLRVGLGRLGVALFAPSHRVELDYRGKTMRLDSTCAGHRVQFDPQWNGEAVSKAKTDIGELTFVWDTGAPMSFIQAALAAKIAPHPHVHAGRKGLWAARAAGHDIRPARRHRWLHRV